MRLAQTICLLAVALCASAATNSLRLAWDYPTNAISDDLYFKLYYSPTVDLPMSNWNYTTFSATNLIAITNAGIVGTNYAFTNPIAAMNLSPSKWFFRATATNLWGESDFTNTVASPVPPIEIKLGIGL